MLADPSRYHLGYGAVGEQGAVALITVLVLLAAALALVTGMNLLAVSESSTATLHVRTNRSLYNGDACAEDALARIIRAADPLNFGGGTFTIGSVCSATLTLVSSGVWNLAVSSADGSVTRRLTINVTGANQILGPGRTIADITVQQWQEATQ